MFKTKSIPSFVAACCLMVTVVAQATAQDGPPEYGPAIDIETAKKVMAGAEAEAKEHNWPVAITILDSGGHLVLFQRLDNTQLGSIELSLEKAKTAVYYRRATRSFEERLSQGGENLKLLKLPGLPMEGGLPIVKDRKVIGSIGVSGVKSTEDAQVGRAGLATIDQKE